jgi:sugar lactone lactonase YvrE
MRRFRSLAILVAIPLLVAGLIRVRYGGGEQFPDRTGEPVLDGGALELVAQLDLPPGNIAVNADGRVFFTFHPDAKPKTKLAEWVDGRAVPWPNRAWQSERDGKSWLDTPLGIRIDAQARLWLVDNANHGMGDAKLLAFDIKRGELVREHHFSNDQAGRGSHLNDLAVHPNGEHVYISEASIFAKTPALIVYDVNTGKARRVLEGHRSVMPDHYYITVDGSPIEVFGLFAVRPGVDSIALDDKGEWLYFAAVTAEKMYRVRTADLGDVSLTESELESRVEVVGDKTVSDGIVFNGDLFLTDPEHNALIRMSTKGELTTLLKDPRLRWPDGLSMGPDGWLYVTCSALQHVIMKDSEHVQAHGPYHIFRFKPDGR